MKKYIVNILTLILLFAFVADGIDVDELLSKTPLQHLDYIGQSTGEDIVVSSSGEACSSSLPAENTFSASHEKAYRVRIQWVDEDSPSLPAVSLATQRIASLHAQKSPSPLTSSSLNHSPDIYFLSRINV